jgi:hypothetical protein
MAITANLWGPSKLALIDHAGSTGNQWELVMSSMSLYQAFAIFTGLTFVPPEMAGRSAAIADAAPCDELDPQERRWQLEWSRRNIED